MRPTKDEYFMHLAIVASTRGTCDRRQVGCVIVDSLGRLLSTGYNGSVPGADHCEEVGHLMINGGCVRTVHAEANAIAHAAASGVAVRGGKLYTTTFPCRTCLQLLISAGITSIVYLEEYHAKIEDEEAVKTFTRQMNVEPFNGARFWEAPVVTVRRTQ